MFVKQISQSSLLPFLLVTGLLLAACGGTAPTGDAGSAPTGAEATGATQPTVAVATQDSGGVPASGACAHPFYPVVLNATHAYIISGEGIDTSNFTQTITEMRADGFTLTSQFDELTLTQQWTCSAEGIAALEYGGGSAAVLSAVGLNAQFKTTNMTGVSLPANLIPGATWNQSFSIEGTMDMGEAGEASAAGSAVMDFEAIGMESVSVAAGTFDAMRVETTTSINMQVTMMGLKVPVMFEGNTISWYAEGIGWIKSDDTATLEGADPIVTTIELQSYTTP
jgi:hypothetical protein